MSDATCIQCGTPTGKRKYCSDKCGKQYRYQLSKTTKPPCSIEGCDRPILGRDLCGPHYGDWYRSQRNYTVTCEYCSQVAQVPRKGMKYCSRACGSRAAQHLATAASAEATRQPVELKQCDWCFTLHTRAKSQYCSEHCRTSALRGPLRAAWEDRHWSTFLRLIKERTSTTAGGCHEWQGRIRDGYAYIKFGRQNHPVHRAVLEAKHGKPLGSQAAHHTCANTVCVNPDHLQPVTHRENVAEMLARNSYLARIRELETALEQLAPTHPLLATIEVA